MTERSALIRQLQAHDVARGGGPGSVAARQRVLSHCRIIKSLVVDAEAFVDDLLSRSTVVSEGTLERRDYLNNLLDEHSFASLSCRSGSFA